MEQLEDIKHPLQAYTSTAKELRKKLTEGEAQYLAGLIDGEGAIYIIGHKKQDTKQHLETKVTIGLAHPTIMILTNKYCGLWYYYSREKRKTKSGESLAPMYVWEWQHPMIKHYFPQIIPYLKLKQEQAKIMLKVVELCMRKPTRSRTDEDRKFIEEAQQKLYNLNHKHYPCDISKYEHLKAYNIAENPKCPKCNSVTWKDGSFTTKKGKGKRYRCKECSYRFKVYDR